MRKSFGLLVAGLCALILAASASAQERQLVTFEVVHTPSSAARDVYLLGDLPELGGDDLTRSVKLVSSDRATWRLTISLPANRTYTYHYYDRFRALPADPTNGIPFGVEIADQTDTVALYPSGKIVYAHSSFDAPVLHWRQDDGSFAALSMTDVAAGRGVGERRWEAGPFGESHRPVEFFLTSADETQRDPADDTTYQTPLDGSLLQDGALFDYVPAAQVSVPRRDFEVTASGLSSVAIHSAILGADYDVRVLLPRGYDEHRFRRYPVIYIGDGRQVWELEGGATQYIFDPDASISTELTRVGAMREVIQVAVDNVGFGCDWVNRRERDFVPGGSVNVGAYWTGCPGMVTGQADRFAAFLRDELRPWIDQQYRTIPDREHTAFSGFSSGALFAVYIGWDFSDTFGRVGSQSLPSSTSGPIPQGAAFLTRVFAEPKRSIRMYVDAGGALGDSLNYLQSLALRDNLLRKTPDSYVLERDLRYVVGALDQDHFAAAAGSRWPEMLPFLFPATEEPPACYDAIDNDGDGLVDYPEDPECASALDPSEGRNDCSDGIDNDGDGHVDSDDPGCPFSYATFENPQCDDGVDNDGNGLVDLEDPNCQNPTWPYWEKAPACGLGAELALLMPSLLWLRRRIAVI